MLLFSSARLCFLSQRDYVCTDAEKRNLFHSWEAAEAGLTILSLDKQNKKIKEQNPELVSSLVSFPFLVFLCMLLLLPDPVFPLSKPSRPECLRVGSYRKCLWHKPALCYLFGWWEQRDTLPSSPWHSGQPSALNAEGTGSIPDISRWASPSAGTPSWCPVKYRQQQSPWIKDPILQNAASFIHWMFCQDSVLLHLFSMSISWF